MNRKCPATYITQTVTAFKTALLPSNLRLKLPDREDMHKSNMQKFKLEGEEKSYGMSLCPILWFTHKQQAKHLNLVQGE